MKTIEPEIVDAGFLNDMEMKYRDSVTLSPPPEENISEYAKVKLFWDKKKSVG